METNTFYHDALVAKLPLMELLQVKSGEHILDLGCGNGNLTAQIAAAGATVLGIDSSEHMIEKAKAQYPSLPFVTVDATTFRRVQLFDAIFSNATIHWIQDAKALVEMMQAVLQVGGRVVAEFAAAGNVSIVMDAIYQVLKNYGYHTTNRHPWYWPTIGEYSQLLEQHQFRVLYTHHFDGVQPLPAEKTIRHWIESYAAYFFHDCAESDIEMMYNEIEAMTAPVLMQNDRWHINISRMRVVAIKE
ncbi:class I SAM-dependent methyltransferase [Paenibacillus yanchengensis]|uniref:Class I SAM-dependent methyltransferase n=1 Tax=Paenibacillus yanchengensis TaxID=2035833 RepID=A0ABW4YQA9_9BACL